LNIFAVLVTIFVEKTWYLTFNMWSTYGPPRAAAAILAEIGPEAASYPTPLDKRAGRWNPRYTCSR
jgi:hypothetical protein